MEYNTSYCQAIQKGELSSLHTHYHDTRYGFPETRDDQLFGRLILEINQAGLSWNTVLQKHESIRMAYANFSISGVARFTESDIETLLKNPGIIRMRKKIEAIIFNAQQIEKLQENHGSFYNWLCLQNSINQNKWEYTFKQMFKFTGKEITREFLMSIGFLPGAHHPDCPVYKKILTIPPMWVKNQLPFL